MRSLRPLVPICTFEVFPAGSRCTTAVPGDLVLVRSSGFVARGIRFFERLRVARAFCWTNHAGIVLTNSEPDATTVAQETARGCVATPIASLDAQVYAVVHFGISPEQRDAVVAFAKRHLGDDYGFLQIPADAFNAVTGLELSLGVGEAMVCSTAATRALERCGLDMARTPDSVMPAHLAQVTNCRLPEGIS